MPTVIGWSLVFGLIAAPLVALVTYWFAERALGLPFASFSSTTVGLIIVWSTMLAFLTPRRTTVFVSVLVFSTCVISGGVLGIIATWDRLLAVNLLTVAIVTPVAALFGALAGAAAVVVVAMINGLGWGVIEQRGQECWRCGHTVLPRALPACPECGLATPLAGTRGVLPRLFGRRSRYALGTVGTVAAVAIGLLTARTLVHMARSGQFREAFVDSAISSDAFDMMARPGYPEWDDFRAFGGSLLPIEGRPDKALLLLYEPLPRSAQRAMQIRLVWRIDSRGGYSDGSPIIASDLSSAQAAQLIASGEVPPTLIDELLSAASDNRWTTAPSQPPPGPYGDVRLVDASPHFAPDE